MKQDYGGGGGGPPARRGAGHSMSLRVRLFLLTLATLIILSVIASGVRYRMAQDVSNTLYDDTLRVVAHAVAREVMLTKGGCPGPMPWWSSLVGALGDPIFYQVAGADGRFVAGYSDAPIDPEGKSLPGGEPVFFDASYYEAPVRVVLLRGVHRRSGIRRLDHGAGSGRPSRKRHALSLQLLVEAGAVLLFVVLGGVAMVLVRHHPGPATSDGSARSGTVAFARRVAPDPSPGPARGRAAGGGDERPVQAARGRIRGAGTPSSRDAAHQLRNPVASIQAQAEAAAGAPDETELRHRVDHLVEAARHASRTHRAIAEPSIALPRRRARSSPLPSISVRSPRLPGVDAPRAPSGPESRSVSRIIATRPGSAWSRAIR